MRHIGLGVCRLDDLRGAGEQRRLLHADGFDLLRQRLEMFEKPRRIGQLRPWLPFCRGYERGARLHGLLFTFGNHAKEGAVAHHGDHAGDGTGLRLVHGLQRRAVLRRAHHAAMHHAGQAHVLHVHRLAGDLAGNVEARDRLTDDSVHAGGLWSHRGGRLALEVERRRQLGIGNPLAVRRADDAIRDAERIRAHLQPRRGKLDQDAAHFRRGEPQRGAGIFDRLRAGGHAFVRRAAGVAGDHGNARERQVELFGRDLRQRRHDPLPQLDLAGEHGRAAVRVDADPGIEHAVAAKAAGQRARLLLLGRNRIEREGQNDAAEAFGEVAAIEGDGHVRSSPSRRRRAARRQRCGCASRSGRGWRRAPRARRARSASDCGRAALWRS